MTETAGTIPFKDMVAILGGLLGFVAFFWRVYEAIYTHVIVEVRIENSSLRDTRVVTSFLSVENKAISPKRIDYAVLVVASSMLSLDEICNAYCLSREINIKPGRKPQPDVFFNDKLSQPHYSKDLRIVVVPLEFFYLEQQNIGNERITYRYQIDLKKLPEDQQLTVRFITFMRYRLGITRWRLSSDLLLT